MRRLSLPLWFSAAATYAFLYAPILVVAVYSFNASKLGSHWGGFTFRWYRELPSNSEKLFAAQNTLVLAIVSTAIATVLGTMLGYGLSRYAFPGKKLFSWLMYIPVVIPDIVMAVAMVLFFTLAKNWLFGFLELGLGTMIVAHITFQIPFVAIVVRSRLAGMDPSVEEASRDLGATGWQTFRHVTLPMIAPGVMAGALLAFTLSLDDFVISFFTAGPGSTTLPILIYSSVKRGITPDINALSTLIVLASVAGVLVMSLSARRRLAAGAVLGAAALGALVWSASSAPKHKLNLFFYSEYIDPQIVRDFEKKFDCRVTLDVYEDMDAMVSKIEEGGDSLYDVITAGDYVVTTMRGRKLLAPLRKENIPNFVNVDPRFANAPCDPGNLYTAPYQWGTVGIYMRPAPGQTIDRTWGLLFDPGKEPGSFLLMDSLRETVGSALKYRGQSINSHDARALADARDLLLAAKRRSLGFDGSVGGRNRVLTHGAVAALVYNGDAVRGIREDPGTVYFVPREGGEIWLDNLCVPARAPNRDMAEKFINYILEPEVGARLSNFNQFATPNRASLPMINPRDLADPAIYPPPEIVEKLEFLEDIGEATRLYDEIWTQVKSK